MIKVTLLLLLAVLLLHSNCSRVQQQGVRFDPAGEPEEWLSAYGFFTGNPADHQPAHRVVPYDLISPLFSDYAEKKRFVFVPEGKTATYDSTEVFDLPVGSALIKTFYYPVEGGSERLIETRVLLRREQGWEALPYRWNEAQTDARLALAGGKTSVRIQANSGMESQEISYLIPNKNQCKGCHNVSGALQPIGPKARNLNHNFNYGDGTRNQLEHWQAMTLLNDLPAEPAFIPTLADYGDPHESTTDRALAYLEINCGHCHRPEGPANHSGLHLSTLEEDPVHLGVWKAPVAAGKGSGGLLVDIHPGRPDSSILLYRMQEADPGIRMPELGRQIAHQEGIALIRDWIAAMDPKTGISP